MTKSNWNASGLLFLRLAIGIIFVAHGWQKAFVFGPDGVAGGFAALGIPFPYANAVFITGLEFIGGLAILAGVATRLVAPLLSATMVVAIATAHLANGFFASNNGYEFPLVLLLASVALTLTGAGSYSIDAAFFGKQRPDVAERESSVRLAA